MYQTKNASAVSHDEGLRQYMLSIYNWMLVGLLISAGTAFFTIESGFLLFLETSPMLFLAIALSPLAIIITMVFGLSSFSESTLKTIYLSFVTLQGVSLGVVVSKYTGASVTTAFLATSVSFGSLSLWGYATKKDLSGWGSGLIMALFGLIAVGLINIFFPSPMLSNLVAIAGVIIFAALTAYDTQKLKDVYITGNFDAGSVQKTVIMGALNLYLDFINMFLYILRLLGEKK